MGRDLIDQRMLEHHLAHPQKPSNLKVANYEIVELLF